MYACIHVILLDATDAHQIINTKSKLRTTYNTKQKNSYSAQIADNVYNIIYYKMMHRKNSLQFT